MHLCSLVVYLGSGIGLSVVRHLVVVCLITCFGYCSFTFIPTVLLSRESSKPTLFPRPFGAHAFPLPRQKGSNCLISGHGGEELIVIYPLLLLMSMSDESGLVLGYDSILVILPSKNPAIC